MSVNRLFGAAVDFASAYGATKQMTAISNAAEAVATLEASHAIIVGDIFEFLTTGWDSLVGQPARAKTVAVNDVTAEAVDTSSTSFFPAGQGAGTVREVSTWTPITQVFQEGGVTIAGGEQGTEEYGFLASARASRRALPTSVSPVTCTVKYYYDRAAAFQSLLKARSVLEENTMLRISLRNGGKILVNGLLRVLPPVAEGNFLAQSLIVYSSVEQMIDYAT